MDLNAEIKCGFEVSVARKKVWQTEIEMVVRVLDICEKHDLKIFACGGTLLGSVRHKGFIPWDDDIDLLMSREDYEKFLSVAAAELEHPFVLQSFQTEKKYYNGHAQIRNSETTCLIRDSFADLKLGKNCGIFIDIFPYDNLPEDKKERTAFWKKIQRLKALSRWKICRTKGLKGLVQKSLAFFYFLFRDVEKTIRKFDALSQKYNGKTSKIAPVSFGIVDEAMVWNEADFKGRINAPFEDITVPIPKNFDAVLTKRYGEYMKIPEDKGGTVHGQAFFDVDKPYTAYRGISEKEFYKLFGQSL